MGKPLTIRQRRLGAELRRLREEAGMSASTAAGLLGTDRSMISNIEAGRFGVSEERIRRLASVYQCDDESLVDGLVRMTERRQKPWWEEYRGKIPPGFIDVSEIEHDALRLRTVQTAHLPGLLQTEEHARALFDLVVPALPRLEVELRVAHRITRQTVITEERATPFVALIHEAALRMQFGGRDVARRQLGHLLVMSELENVTIRVIPFAAGGFPMAGESVLYAEARTSRLDTVHMDSPTGAVFIDSPTQLAHFRTLFDVIETVALPAEKSRDFILAIAKDA
ncbi:helix-turn-helix transcriptional regulator [Streptomyces pactum]|uniref:Helix-turn-helix transcriptional regulator n=1 Tax=Streptomyces pactum TaxID=68249 RepID=A0ABS0NPM3_9ACTN|nr:helix-turn-helix transcriptional regulator [Streptomyces pactum]MBH5337131.1 helix-turn-helix transcriptional regulator [Streptomyces pactum]